MPPSNFSRQKKPPYKYFSLIAMIFVTVSLCDVVMIYRTVEIGPYLLSGGAFIMPLYYYLIDVIAEVYGYKYARQTTWVMFFCSLIFSLIISLAIKLTVFHSLYQTSYETIFGHLFRVTFGGTLITVLTATFINSYVLSKWKILVRGKYFWMRSLGASGIGEAVEVFTECLILYAGMMPFQKVVFMILPTFIMHMILGFLIILPGAIIVKLLKIAEGTDVYDYNTSFNPFKFKIDQNAEKTSEVNIETLESNKPSTSKSADDLL